MERPISDDSLIRRCLAGEASAWNELVEKYARLVHAIGRNQGLPSTEADDLVQVVFLKLGRRLSTIREESKLSSWLITTTRREAWRLRSGARVAYSSSLRLEEGLESGPPATEAVDPAESERWERRALVDQALRTLGDPCASLLRALFSDQTEGKYDEIARSLGMKIGSIGPTRARCFAKLETILRYLGLEA